MKKLKKPVKINARGFNTMIGFFDIVKHIEKQKTFLLRDYTLYAGMKKEEQLLEFAGLSMVPSEVYSRAVKLFRMGCFEAASKELALAFKLNQKMKSGDAEKSVAEDVISSADIVSGLTERAKSVFDNTLAISIKTDFAICEFYLNGFEAAIQEFESMKHTNDNVFIKWAIVAGYLGNLDIKDELHLLEKGLALNPRNIEGLLVLALRNQELSSQSFVCGLFETIIGIDPRYDEAYLDYADYCVIRKEIDKAEKLYRKALELNPRNDGAYFKLGDLYRIIGKKEVGDEMQMKAIVYNPTRPCYQSIPIMIAVETGDSIANVVDRAFEKHMTEMGDRCLINWGRFYKAIRDLNKDYLGVALEKFDTVVKMKPNDDFAYFELAEAFYCAWFDFKEPKWKIKADQYCQLGTEIMLRSKSRIFAE
jgi:tetratricopeptide (TPR) repeat protein